MNSYRCSQCGLTNWTTTEFCKRCKSPNPNFVYTQQTAQYADHAQHNGYGNQPNYAPQNYNPFQPQPDFSAPPPPNAFGNETGTANYGANYGHYPQNGYHNQSFRGYNQTFLSDQEQNELSEAEKQIKSAWVSGVVICVITAIVGVLRGTVFNNGTEEATFESIGMLISVFIMGGLTFGIYFKSRACAVILCGLFVLDKVVTFAATRQVGGILIAIILIYYLGYGIKGTFTHYNLTKGRR